MPDLSAAEWFDVAAESVREGNDQPFLDSEQRVDRLNGQVTRNGGACDVLPSRARALRGLTAAAISQDPKRFLAAADDWARAHAADPATGRLNEPADLDPTSWLASGRDVIVHRLVGWVESANPRHADHLGGAAAAMVEVLARAGQCSRPEWDAVGSTHVLVDTFGGTTEPLRLSALRLRRSDDGPCRIFADPSTMLFLRTDQAFDVAVEATVAYVRGAFRTVGYDIKWQLDVGALGDRQIRGGSAGVMFAALFTNAVAARPRRFAPRSAGTGTISVDGTVTSVGPLGTKEDAAVGYGPVVVPNDGPAAPPFRRVETVGAAYDVLAPIPVPEGFIELRFRPEGFRLDRRELAEALRAKVGSRKPGQVVGLVGSGGMGKSWLAAMYAWDLDTRIDFPDGICRVSLAQSDGETELRARLSALGELVGVALRGETADRLSVELRERLRDKAVLLVVDNVWQGAHLDRLRVVGPEGAVIATTRFREGVLSDDDQSLPVDTITDEEAWRLFAHHVGGIPPGLEDAASQIVALLGGITIAIPRAAGFVRKIGWEEALAELPSRLRQPDVALTGPTIDSLPGDLRHRVFDLAVFRDRGEFTLRSLRALWDGEHEATAGTWLEQLMDRCLVNPVTGRAGTTYMIHDHDLAFLAVPPQAYAPGVGRRGAQLHRQLIRGYGEPTGWGDVEDQYFLRSILAHLLAAEQRDAVPQLLSSVRFMQSHGSRFGLASLQAAFDDAINALGATAGPPTPAVGWASGPAPTGG